jgi:hypothetical protein
MVTVSLVMSACASTIVLFLRSIRDLVIQVVLLSYSNLGAGQHLAPGQVLLCSNAGRARLNAATMWHDSIASLFNWVSVGSSSFYLPLLLGPEKPDR